MEDNSCEIKTPIGFLTLKASNKGLTSIEFGAHGSGQTNSILELTKKELHLYFQRGLKHFSVPLDIKGTLFQQKAWNALIQIPYGETRSYKEQAITVAGATYTRAVAGANNKNKLPIIIPCHRVIGSNGDLVGYAGGLDIKKKLLDIEKNKA